jgi:hypothetical protein
VAINTTLADSLEEFAAEKSKRYAAMLGDICGGLQAL